MKRLLSLLMLIVALPLMASTPPWIGDRTRFIEGIILYPDDQYIAANMMNCQPQVPSDAEFSETVLYTRLPEPGHGPVSQAFCRYHARDPWMWTSPGDWVESHGTCYKTCSTAAQTNCLADTDCPNGGTCIAWAAVATRTQFDMSSGGGDGGCDSIGLIEAIAALDGAAIEPPDMELTSQFCHIGKRRRKCKAITNEKARLLRHLDPATMTLGW
jgi:hypothetical protein